MKRSPILNFTKPRDTFIGNFRLIFTDKEDIRDEMSRTRPDEDNLILAQHKTRQNNSIRLHLSYPSFREPIGTYGTIDIEDSVAVAIGDIRMDFSYGDITLYDEEWKRLKQWLTTVFTYAAERKP